MNKCLLVVWLVVFVWDAKGAAESVTFTKVMGEPIVQVSGVGAAWGDFDNDGYLDIFIGATTNNPTQNSPNKLFRNRGNGTFEVVPAPRFPADIGVISAGFVDFDNDGWLDVFGSKLGGDILDRNNGDGTFSRTVNPITSDTAAGVGSAWADFDGDGFVDLFVANEGSSNALFRNNGHGRFVKMTNAIFNLNVSSQAAAWADYDSDGRPDLFVANYHNNKNLLYHNDGGGEFTRVTAGVVANEAGGFGACAWGDYDNDGYFDLALGSYGPVNVLYHNNGAGGFTKVSSGIVVTDPMHCASIAWGDFDNDGFLDLMVSGEVAPYQHTFLYRNNGDGSFAKIQTGAVVTDKGEGRACAFVDYDRDGFLDIWVARTFGYMNGLYHNEGNSNGWIEVTCEGRVSNRAAIGTKIRVKAVIGGREMWQLRQITATETVAHFGLGDAARVEMMRVEWPSGIVQEFVDLPAKQFLTTREPSRIDAAQSSGGKTILNLRGANGCVYCIERSLDLTTWTDWMTITNQSGVEEIDLAPLGSIAEEYFFRAKEQP